MNFVLPVTIRLLPAKDGSGHWVSNDSVGNYATLDLGQSLGKRVIGLGGYVDAEIRFHDSYDSGQPGNVDVAILPDDARVISTSLGLLTNPDTSTRASGSNHEDLLDLSGASAGAFDLVWADPDGANHVALGIDPVGLTADDLDAKLEAALGVNNVSVTAAGPGRFEIFLSGKYAAPDLQLNSFKVLNNTTGAAISVANLATGGPSQGGCRTFSGIGAGDVDRVDRMAPSFDPGTDNVGPNWQWDPLGFTNERDVVLRTGPLSLSIDHDGESVVPAGNMLGDDSGNGVAGSVVGRSGGVANIFGLPVDGLADGTSVDVTVNLKTKVNTIARQVDAALPRPSGQPAEELGAFAAYFDCRQFWTGWVENHLQRVHLVGSLKISPAITADGRLRIAKIFLSSDGPSRQALAACLVPFSTFASGNQSIGDSVFSSGPWLTNPIGPSLVNGTADSAHFDPRVALNPTKSSLAPDVPCDASGGPLDRNPFNVIARGATGLEQMLRSGAAVAVAGDLTVQKLTGEVIIGHFPNPPSIAVAAPGGAQLVAGVSLRPGRAGVRGRTGCPTHPFSISVRGTSMSRVVFRIDGKVVDRFPNVIGNKATIRVIPKRYRVGLHRVAASVTFESGSGTKPRTLHLTFQRCTALATPHFTG